METTEPKSDFVDAYMHIDRNVQGRHSLPPKTLQDLVAMLESRRDYLTRSINRSEEYTRADIARWEAELRELASAINNTANRELVSVFGGILQASGIERSEPIGN